MTLPESCRDRVKSKKGVTSIVTPSAVVKISEILLEEIDLAKPDDLAFLEFQVPRIAERIAFRLGFLCDRQE